MKLSSGYMRKKKIQIKAKAHGWYGRSFAHRGKVLQDLETQLIDDRHTTTIAMRCKIPSSCGMLASEK